MTPLLSDLNWRYATKEFDPQKKLSPPALQELCEALRLTPSSFGLQLWKFLMVSNPELKTQLRAVSWNQSQVTDCSHLCVFCSPTTIGDDAVDRFIEATCQACKLEGQELAGYAQMIKSFVGQMDQPGRWHWMDKQIYLALGNLLTSCAVKRIDASPLEGFSPQDYDQILELSPQGLRSVVVCALGYRGATDKYAQAPKVRYPLDEILVHYP